MTLRSRGENPSRNRDFRFTFAIAGFEKDIKREIQEPPLGVKAQQQHHLAQSPNNIFEASREPVSSISKNHFSRTAFAPSCGAVSVQKRRCCQPRLPEWPKPVRLQSWILQRTPGPLEKGIDVQNPDLNERSRKRIAIWTLMTSIDRQPQCH